MSHPRKRFGQHFLRDATIIQRIVDALAPNLLDHLVEIGPGQGAITFPVLKKQKYLEAIELDRNIIPILEKRAQSIGELVIYPKDVLQFDFSDLKQDERLLRVFGNLPYNISTPLIFHLLTYSAIIKDMIFMLQKEVAERLSAKTSTKAYGRLSVMVQYFCKVELLFEVPPSAFSPPPQVMSAIVRLIPYTNKPVVATNFTLFSEIVKKAFGQRRKTLRNSLKELVPSSVWERASISATQRAETLSVADFVQLSNLVTEL